MSAIDDAVHAQLQMLARMQLDGMEPEAALEWKNKINLLKTQYDAARRKEKDDKSTAAEKKYAKDLGDSIAKGLPLIVKGLQAAISAFDKGDTVTGSAAIMDICAAAAPIIGALAGATGPEGALVGSFFSVIGQILSFFAPKQASLKDQIQSMLKELDAEEQLQGLGAVSLSNEVLDRELTANAGNLANYSQLSLLIRTPEKAEFDDWRGLSGKRIVVDRGSRADAAAHARYPECTILFVDEVARNQSNPREYVVTTLIANHQADAFFGINANNSDLRDQHAGTAIADIHQDGDQRLAILELPLLTEDDADEFETRMKALNFSIWRAKAKADHGVFKTWEVAAWLKMESKQSNPKWPEVLGVWCRTYHDIVNTNIKFNCLVDLPMVKKLVRYTHDKDGSCPLPRHRKDAIRSLLTDLLGLAMDLRSECVSFSEVVLEVLDAVTPAAQAWGWFAILGTNNGLFFTSRAVSMNWSNKSDTNYYHRMTVFAPESNHGSSGSPQPEFELKPRYHCLLLKSNGGDYPSTHSWLDHLLVRPDTLSIVDSRLIRDQPMFFDICAAQRAGSIDCWAIPGGRDGIERWSLNKAGDFQPGPGGFIRVDGSKLETVRALYPTLASPVEGDPDSGSIEPRSAWLDPAEATYSALLYAGLRASRDIYVHRLNDGYRVPSPWSDYIGIAVDRHYVWVFSHWGIACATHASIIACVLKKRTSPRWMEYSIPAAMLGRYPYFDEHHVRQEDRDGWAELGNPTTMKGLLSLSPCADGTMLASVVYRGFGSHANPWTGQWTAFDDPRIYTTHYTIDVAGQSLQIVEPWTRIDGQAYQVQKMPIPCWSLMASLREELVFK